METSKSPKDYNSKTKSNKNYINNIDKILNHDNSYYAK